MPEEQLANDFATIAIMPLRSICNTQAWIETHGAVPLAEQMHNRRVWLFENYGIGLFALLLMERLLTI